MKHKSLLAAVLIVTFSATSASACCPPPPPPHWGGGGCSRGYSSGALIAAGVGGLLLGALMGSSSARSSNANNNAADSRRTEEAVNAYRQQSRESAKTQLDVILETLKTTSVHETMVYIDNYWKSQNKTSVLSENGYESKILVTNFDNDYSLSYKVDASRGLASVTVSNSKFGVSETVNGTFTPQSASVPSIAAQPQAQAQAQPAQPVQPPVYSQNGQDASIRISNNYPYIQVADAKQLNVLGTKLMGFTISQEDRTPEGYLRVSNVQPATAAAYIGLANGSALYKVDNYSTAEIAVDTIHTYIVNRARENRTVALTFSVNGKHKTARIKP